MNNKVTDLETSKQLQPHMSGVKHSFHWVRSRNNKYNKWKRWYLSYNTHHPIDDILWQYVPAYDLQDILGGLPKKIGEHGGNYPAGRPFMMIDLEEMYLGYVDTEFRTPIKGSTIKFQSTNTLTQAAAQLKLWTVSEGYVK